MGLKLRLRHALEERLADFPTESATAEQPWTVGRGTSSSWQVPSVLVARSHCALFVHNDRLFIQDAGSDTGTYVNGARISGPTKLRAGDVVQIGNEPNPPMIRVGGGELPPVDAAQSVQAARAEAPVVRPVAPIEAPIARPMAPIVPSVQFEAHEDEAGPGEGDAVAGPAYSEEHEAAGDDDAIADLAGTAAGSSSLTYASPRRRQVKTSTGQYLVGGAILLVLVGILVGIFLRYQSNQKAQAAAAAAAQAQAAAAKPRIIVASPNSPTSPTDIPDDTTPFKAGTMFGNAGVKPKPAAPAAAVAGVPTPARPVRAASPTSVPTPADPDNPGDSDPLALLRADPEWVRVDEASRLSKPNEAIVIFDDYAAAHPNTPLKPDLDRMTDEVMDMLWWQRIKDLLDRRGAVKLDLKQVKSDLNTTVDASARKQLTTQQKRDDDELVNSQEVLTLQMKYTSPDPPDLYDSAKLAALREKRDAAAFDAWKKKTLAWIRKTRGALPW